MQTCICIGGLVALADLGAWAVSAETGDSRWVVLITSGTAIAVALCTAVVMIAPHVAKAITSLAATILPALAMIRRQNEELNKGTLAERIETLLEQNRKLAEQNEKLQATIEEDRESTEKARKTLHEIRNEFNIATLQHREQREALIAQTAALTESLEGARREIADLKEHDSRVLKGVKIEQKSQAAAIIETQAAVVENKAAIQVTAAVAEQTAAAVEQINVERSAERSGEMPAVGPEDAKA